MDEIIKNFYKQFAYEPKVENEKNLARGKRFVVAGMGGSNLAAGIIKMFRPKMEILIHRDYGLPPLADAAAKDILFIISSYSGNTAETLSAFDEAKRRGFHMAVITTGGELLVKAKKDNIPYVQIPDLKIPPRMALGFSFLAHLKLMGEEELLLEAQDLAEPLKPNGLGDVGRALAKNINNRIPLIYSTNAAEPLAYNWKIRLNETGKVPTFCGLSPELAHNEIAGFDIELPRHLRGFFIIFLRDPEEASEAAIKMDKLEAFLSSHDLPSERVTPAQETKLARIFTSIIIADWVAYYVAMDHGLNPEESRVIDDFKKMV